MHQKRQSLRTYIYLYLQKYIINPKWEIKKRREKEKKRIVIKINLQVKQITTAHTFSSTDPRHYPQRRRVVHSNHRGKHLSGFFTSSFFNLYIRSLKFILMLFIILFEKALNKKKENA